MFIGAFACTVFVYHASMSAVCVCVCVCASVSVGGPCARLEPSPRFLARLLMHTALIQSSNDDDSKDVVTHPVAYENQSAGVIES